MGGGGWGGWGVWVVWGGGVWVALGVGGGWIQKMKEEEESKEVPIQLLIWILPRCCWPRPSAKETCSPAAVAAGTKRSNDGRLDAATDRPVDLS